jgi:hypothetical protein
LQILRSASRRSLGNEFVRQLEAFAVNLKGQRADPGGIAAEFPPPHDAVPGSSSFRFTLAQQRKQVRVRA